MACAVSPQCAMEDICGWSGQTITAMEATTFRVKIGPSGGQRGYEHITGEIILKLEGLSVQRFVSEG